MVVSQFESVNMFPQIDVRVSALSMVYDLLMRFGLQAFVSKDDSDNVEDHSDITALLDVELSARKRHLVRDSLLSGLPDGYSQIFKIVCVAIRAP